MNTLHRTLAILAVSALPLPCIGADNLQLSGTLLAPPGCTVSDKGGRMNVRFEGNIATNRIDGKHYRRQTIPYQIDCPGAANSNITWRMRLILKGAHTYFDPTALQTSEADLGIRVLLGNEPLIPGQSQEIYASGSQVPTLEAVPVKAINAVLSSTDFTASALLIAELY